MKIIKDYLRLIIFSFGLLVGVQVPAFIDQYVKRVDAKLLESSQILAGFQLTADRHFSGSIEKLIEHYKNSNDLVFNQDSSNIEFIYRRVTFLQEELVALNANSLSRAWHVLVRHDNSILQETVDNYSYMIILQPVALLWGLMVAFLLALCVDCVLGLLLWLVVKPKVNAF